MTISRDAMKALRQMDKMVHSKPTEPAAVSSVFIDCPCTKCMDGGIDMPYCAECDRANGFRFFRKKVR